MANFYYVTVLFANGTKRNYHGLMYYLGGQKAPGYYKLEKMKQILYRMFQNGIVKDVCIDYES